MIFDAIIKNIKAQKLAGIRYQKEGQAKYRDRVTVYRDGKILFERFCYGEAAGLVLSLKGIAEDELLWDYAACLHSQKAEAPKILDKYENNSLFFDNHKAAWQEKELLKSDGRNGYSRLSVIFGK